MGDVLAVVACSFFDVADVLLAEVLAARDGLLLAIQQVVTKVILETNNTRSPSFTLKVESEALAGVWHEIRELSISFTFVCDGVVMLTRIPGRRGSPRVRVYAIPVYRRK
jgi:hypothetical protein